MKQWIVVLIGIVFSAITGFVTARSVGSSAEPRRNDTSRDLLLRLERASERMVALEGGRRPRESTASPQAAPAASARTALDDVDAAVARWMAANADRLAGAPAPAVVPVEDAGRQPANRAASMSLDKIMSVFLLADSVWDEEGLWQEVRDAGRIDEVVAEFERMALEDPNNPDLQVALAGAYLQQLFDAGASPLAGELALKADGAFDRALELDPQHWEARFSKAVSLSNWPAFLGKTAEAIHQFEVLVEVQRSQKPRPEFAQAYLYLGNLFQQTGEAEKAFESWRAGIAAYPDNVELRRQLASNERR